MYMFCYCFKHHPKESASYSVNTGDTSELKENLKQKMRSVPGGY